MCFIGLTKITQNIYISIKLPKKYPCRIDSNILVPPIPSDDCCPRILLKIQEV